MKKTLIALAVLGSVAGVAQAQSAVTVYGKLDLGLQKVTGTPTQLDANHQSRLGFKGTEDLGNGLSAIFQIESRFQADNGTVKGYKNAAGVLETNPLFGGQSIVGLKGAFGTVKLGRTYNVVDGVASGAADPFEGDGIADMGTGTAARLSNTVTYISPNMSGFSASAQAQLHENTTGTGGKNGYGITGAYENGPISAGLGYQKLTVVGTADQADIWGVNAAYAFGPAKVMLGYDRKDPKGSATKEKHLVLGATYEVGAGLIKAAYSQLKTTATDRKYAIGYQHNLSKRTSVYADVARTNFADTTPDTNGVQVGVTHNF